MWLMMWLLRHFSGLIAHIGKLPSIAVLAPVRVDIEFFGDVPALITGQLAPPDVLLSDLRLPARIQAEVGGPVEALPVERVAGVLRPRSMIREGAVSAASSVVPAMTMS
jgi:hypothetical protein